MTAPTRETLDDVKARNDDTRAEKRPVKKPMSSEQVLLENLRLMDTSIQVMEQKVRNLEAMAFLAGVLAVLSICLSVVLHLFG